MQISVSCVRLRVRNPYLVQNTQQMLQLKQHIWIRLQIFENEREIRVFGCYDGWTYTVI